MRRFIRDAYNPQMRGFLSKLLGDKGERAAAQYLRKQGMKIIERQSRNFVGEIDLVAKDGDCIVFVEVKTRSSTLAGHPYEAITAAKQKKLTRLALVWLKERRLLNTSARFDVVSIVWPAGTRTPTIDHFVNAFEAVGRGQMFS